MTKQNHSSLINHLFGTEENSWGFLVTTIFDGYGVINVDTPDQSDMNDKFWNMLGFSDDEKPPLSSIIDDKTLSKLSEAYEVSAKNQEERFSQRVRLLNNASKTVTFLFRGKATKLKSNKDRLLFVVCIDIDENSRAYSEINQLKNEYEKVFNGTQDALFLMRVDGYKQFTYLRNNESHQYKTGLTQSFIENKTPRSLLGQEGGEVVSQNYQRCVDAGGPVSYEETLNLPAGERVWYTTLTPIFSNETITHIVGSAVDITERKALENRLYYRAHYDALTGLANRQYFFDYIHQCIDEGKAAFILLYIDLDGFKQINDTYGHVAGDTMLKAVSRRLKKSVTSEDFVARIGGDEFVVLRCDDTNENMETLIKSLHHAISQPVTHQDNAISCGASIGYARYPFDGNNPDQLINSADRSMYRYKTIRDRRLKA